MLESEVMQKEGERGKASRSPLFLHHLTQPTAHRAARMTNWIKTTKYNKSFIFVSSI